MWTNNNLTVTQLDEEAHKKTCGYWYLVTCGSSSHTAFRTLASLRRWLSERNLFLEDELTGTKEIQSVWINGKYRQKSHMSKTTFAEVVGNESRTMSNGEYVEAKLEVGDDGIVTVHTLNPNVKARKVFDYQESLLMVG